MLDTARGPVPAVVAPGELSSPRKGARGRGHRAFFGTPRGPHRGIGVARRLGHGAEVARRAGPNRATARSIDDRNGVARSSRRSTGSIRQDTEHGHLLRVGRGNQAGGRRSWRLAASVASSRSTPSCRQFPLTRSDWHVPLCRRRRPAVDNSSITPPDTVVRISTSPTPTRSPSRRHDERRKRRFELLATARSSPLSWQSLLPLAGRGHGRAGPRALTRLRVAIAPSQTSDGRNRRSLSAREPHPPGFPRLRPGRVLVW
jgi:hypothetical protein